MTVLDRDPSSELRGGLSLRAADTGGSIDAAIELARSLGSGIGLPGSGETAQRWALLTEIARGDLSAARIAEAHLDALAILAEAGRAGDASTTWGVYAAEGPGTRLEARPDGTRWILQGTKPWCSGAAHLDRALVTAHLGDGGRRLFAVDLGSPGVTVERSGWVSRGLAEVASGPVDFAGVYADPVGETGWYLTRPGFAWGGMGVAACWYGGLLGLADTLWASAQSREPDQVGLMHLGRVDLHVQRAGLVMDDASRRVDDGRANGQEGVVLAERVRGIVAAAAEAVIEAVGHALGPAPLAMDEAHSRRVADLQIYLRQHHAQRDSARLGRLLVDAGRTPW